MVNKKVICLGGGIGTVNLIKGLKRYVKDITVVVSMADDGGSSGRLRRLYNIPPPGDLVSCMTALLSKNNSDISKMLLYRFKGDRYGKDKDLGGQKVGNLILTSMLDITQDFTKAIELFKNTFKVKGAFIPATSKAVSISAVTIEGKTIHREEVIDKGKYKGKRVLEKVFLNPQDAAANPEFLTSIKNADVIIAGPGDLYTTILPVLIVKGVKEAFQKSNAQKFFVINVTNKPFETKGYSVNNYIDAVTRHLGFFPFTKVVVNNNYKPKIPSNLKYKYVKLNEYSKKIEAIQFVKNNLVDKDFPLYHNPEKLAKTIIGEI